MSAVPNAAPIAVSMGDPAGIGPEVILKAAASWTARRGAPRLLVVGDLGCDARGGSEFERAGPTSRGRGHEGQTIEAGGDTIAVLEASQLGTPLAQAGTAHRAGRERGVPLYPDRRADGAGAARGGAGHRANQQGMAQSRGPSISRSFGTARRNRRRQTLAYDVREPPAQVGPGHGAYRPGAGVRGR